MIVVLGGEGKGFRRLIVAERRSVDRVDCRARRWPPWPTMAIEGGAPTVAFDVHLEDGGVVDDAVDRGERHGGLVEAFMMPPSWTA